MVSRFLRCGAAALSLAALWAGTGCSTTTGSFVPQSAYVYPNSNVRPLGPTSASTSHTAIFIFTPTLDVHDVKDTYDKAVANVNGANMVVNYNESTTFFEVPYIFSTITYSISGEAVRQDVGYKPLTR